MKKVTLVLHFFCLGLIFSSCKDIKELFNKKKPDITPLIKETTVSNIKTTSATVSSTITTIGTKPTTEFGFCYATTSEFSIADAKIVLGSTPTDNQGISTEIKTLQPNTLYYVKAYITQENTTTVYGEATQFTTASLQAPKVTTADATDIKFNTFSISGQLTDIGTSDVTEYGHALSETNKEPTTADIVTKMGTANTAPKDFKSVFSALKANSTYYVRAYATNTTGTGYSEVKTIKTGALELAKVQIIGIADVSFNSANVSGKISEQGTNPVTDFGHVISKTNQNPTTADTKTSLGVPSAIPKDYVSSFTGLELNTKYYTRSYAVSEAGVAYSEVKSFTTLAKIAPSLTTKDISNITHNTASVSGTISAQGSHVISDYGHVISKNNQNPTTADTKTSLGATTTVPKDFLSTFNGLEANTTYYTRAYAISEGGTGYGEVKSFKTLSLQVPSVSTISASSGSATTGGADGKITSLGTSNSVTDFGFCYSSTNQTPTIADTKKGLGSTTNANEAFKAGFDNLTPNTTYYVRAYATSSVGSGYGEVKSFKTANEVSPTFSNYSWSWGPIASYTSAFCNSVYSEITKEKKFTDPCNSSTIPNLELWYSYNVSAGTEPIVKAGVCAIAISQQGDPTINDNSIEFDYSTNNKQVFVYNVRKNTGITKTVYCTVAAKTATEYYYLNPLIPSDFGSAEYKFKVRPYVKTTSGKIIYGSIQTYIASSSCQVN